MWKLEPKAKQEKHTERKMKNKSTYLTVIAAAALASLSGASANVITDWNQITVSSTKTAGLNSNLGSRIDAIEAIAVYDAVNSIRQIGTPYHYYAPSTGPASAEAAAAQAAHDVLVNYFPAQQSTLDAELAATLGSIPAGVARDNGVLIGAASAADIIALRSSDGASPNVTYPGPANPGPASGVPHQLALRLELTSNGAQSLPSCSGQEASFVRRRRRPSARGATTLPSPRFGTSALLPAPGAPLIKPISLSSTSRTPS